MHPRLKYRETLLFVHKRHKGSKMSYEESKRSRYKDLVLRDSKGQVICKVQTYGTFENDDICFYGIYSILNN